MARIMPCKICLTPSRIDRQRPVIGWITPIPHRGPARVHEGALRHRQQSAGRGERAEVIGVCDFVHHRPIAQRHPRGNAPFALSPLHPVNIAAATHGDRLALAVHADEHKVGFGMGGIAVNLGRMVQQQMLMRQMRRRMLTKRPIHEFIRRADKFSVFIQTIGVKRRPDQITVESVNPTTVAEQTIVDRLAVKKMLQRI
jgi:hypothetical protein